MANVTSVQVAHLQVTFLW